MIFQVYFVAGTFARERNVDIFFDIFCGTGYCLPSAAKRTVSALWVGFPYFAVLRGSSHPADGTKGTPIPAALFYAKLLPWFPFPSSAFLTFFLHYNY
ncbi:MAG: hypothetical protein IKP51_12125 [Treponema sp.]|nr:hypothetical protein [Treponema sp.]